MWHAKKTEVVSRFTRLQKGTVLTIMLRASCVEEQIATVNEVAYIRYVFTVHSHGSVDQQNITSKHLTETFIAVVLLNLLSFIIVVLFQSVVFFSEKY